MFRPGVSSAIEKEVKEEQVEPPYWHGMDIQAVDAAVRLEMSSFHTSCHCSAHLCEWAGKCGVRGEVNSEPDEEAVLMRRKCVSG